MLSSIKKLISLSLSFVCFFAFTQVASAQTKTKKATVQQGAEVDTKRSSIIEISGTDETGYYSVRSERKKLFIEHLNKEMVTDKSQEIIEEAADNYNYCTLMEGNFYLFTINTDKKARTSTLGYHKVNKKTLVVDPVSHDLVVAKVGSKRDFFGNLFQHSISPDESSLLYYSVDKERDEAGNLPTDSRFHLAVFDSQLKKQWEKDIKIALPPEQFSVQQVKVDNNGVVYIIGIEYQEKSDARISRRAGTPSFTYRIYRYAANGNDVTEIPIELKDKFITDVQVDAAPNGDFIAAGFYSEKGTFSVKGAFYICIDGKTRDIKAQKYSEFESDFVTQYFTAKEKNKQKKKEAKGDEPELFDFEMDELLIRADGGATLIAEQFRTYTVCTTTTNANGTTSTTCTTYYVYNDIMVLSFEPDGSLAWKCKIPKRQTTSQDGGYYSSYAFAAVGDKLYFVYNDNPKNTYLKPGEPIYFFSPRRDVAVILAEVDATGKVTRELLMTTEKGDINIRPKLCVQTGTKEMLILAEKSKLYQFSKVEFK